MITERQHYPNSDPRHHIVKIRGMLNDTINHMREDVVKVHDPRAQALFEITAEVLRNFVVTYEHFEQQSEPFWH